MEPLRQPTHLGIPPINPKAHSLSIQGTDNINFDAPRAGFGIRGLACIVDVLGVVALSEITTKILVVTKIFGDQNSTIVSALLDLIFFMLVIVIPTALSCKSLGKKVFKLKVVSLSDSSKIGFMKGFFREFVGKSVSCSFFLIGYLLALGPQKLTLHDRLFKTKVIKQ